MAAAIGEMIGPLTEGMASAAQYQASKHERNIAWKRAQQWELIGPGLRSEGLKRAGINPMVAFLGGGGGAHGGMAQPAMASTGAKPNFSSAGAFGRVQASAKQAQMMSDQVATVAAQRSEAESKAVAARYLPERFYHEAGLAGLMTAKVEAEASNLLAQRGLTTAHTAQSEAQRLKIQVERQLLRLGVPGARAMANLYTEHPELKQLKESGFLGKVQILGDEALERSRGAGVWGEAVDRALKAKKRKPGWGWKFREVD